MVVTGLLGATRLTAHKWQLILYTVCCAGTRWKIAPCNKLPHSITKIRTALRLPCPLMLFPRSALF
jgi:hypothetical protein